MLTTLQPHTKDIPNMRILILGAGATGGYYGGRLAKAGRDVTFLVRPHRKQTLDSDGLTIKSQLGAVMTPVAAITTDDISTPFDAIVLSCKAYDLASAMTAIQPAVGPDTLILPLLNGMRHLDQLDGVFGQTRVLGGTCHISVTLTEAGVVRHMSPFDGLTLEARWPSQLDRARALHAAMSGAGFDVRFSDTATGAMWDKWVLLATLAGMTCLMRASIGEIVATRGGQARISAMLDECCAVAAACGHPSKPAVVLLTRTTLTDPESSMTSSMLRDLQRGDRIEADHIIGDFVERGAAAGVATPLLDAVYGHLQAYQNRLPPPDA